MTFDEAKDDLTDRVDFIVCLGGDGTLLYASSLFQKSVPPVMAFHLVSYITTLTLMALRIQRNIDKLLNLLLRGPWAS